MANPTPETIRVSTGEVLPVDLDGDPYRTDSETLGPWKVTPCCGSYAKGCEDGIRCRVCYEPVANDGPARLPKEEDDREPDELDDAAICDEFDTAVGVVVDGERLVVGIVVGKDATGEQFIQLVGANCDLDGEAPGLYYPRPR